MVNENFWGSENSWVSYDNDVTFSPATNKENYTFAYGRNGENPPTQLPDGEKFDLSCAPWGIGGDSILCKLSYMLPICDSNLPLSEQKIFTFPVDSEKYGKPHPIILTGSRHCTVPGSVLSNTYGQQDGRIHLSDSYEPAFTPAYSAVSDKSFWTQNVICNFDYSKIVLVPYIVTTPGTSYDASNINSNSYDYFTFSNVLSNWSTIEGHKAIRGIQFDAYFGSAGSRSNHGAGFQINIPQLYPKIENVDPQQGTPNPTVDTSTLISNGYHLLTSTTMGKVISNGFNKMHYYDDVDTKEKSLQWWSGHGNPVSHMDKNWIIFQENPSVSGDKAIRPIFDYSGKTAEQVVNYFIKQVALLGFAFCLNPSDVQGIIGENNSICLPVFDNNGITTGKYKQGIECRELPNFTWRDDVWDKNKYNPYQQRDDIDQGDLDNSGRWNMFPATLKAYAMDFNDIAVLINSLNDLYSASQHPIEQNMIDYQGSNPSDYIVGLYGTPCELVLSNTPETIKIGGVSFTGHEANTINMTANGLFDCGSVRVPAEFSDFRDYEPYTTIELYLPLCGTITLDTAFFVGHDVNVVYTYDVLTMSCTACVYRDGITLYATVNGTIGAELPLSALRMGDYQNTIHSLESAHKQNNIRLATSAVGVGVGAVSLLAAPETGGLSLAAGAGILAGLGGVAGGLYQASDINYQISHKYPALSQTGSADAQNGFSAGSMYPYLFIKRVKMLPEYDDEVYAHTIGHACNINATLDTVSGYTVATNVDLSGFTASSEEKQMISDLLSRGVYL